MAERRWVVVWFESEGVHDCAIVHADSEEEAAEIGMTWLQREEEHETVDNVFVAPWDKRTAYSRRLAVEKSEMQCCGGPSNFTEDGHYATCRERPREEPDEQAA